MTEPAELIETAMSHSEIRHESEEMTELTSLSERETIKSFIFSIKKEGNI